MLSLLGRGFGGWHGDDDAAVWNWKFEANPDGPAHIYVGDDDGQLAGCYVLLPVILNVDGSARPGAQAVDAAVDPAYRGRHIFTDLAAAALRESTAEGIQPLFAFPSQGALGGQVRVGYRPQAPIPDTYCPLLPSIRRRPKDFTLVPVERFDERFDAFADAGRKREISVRRNAAYLQWRFNDHPINDYQVIACERDGELRGYSVLSILGSGRWGTLGCVVDLQVLEESEAAARFLAYHSVRRLREMGARIGISWERPKGPEQAGLRSVGFSTRYSTLRRRLRREQQPPRVIAFVNDDDWTGPPYDPAWAWALTAGDSDFV